MSIFHWESFVPTTKSLNICYEGENYFKKALQSKALTSIFSKLHFCYIKHTSTRIFNYTHSVFFQLTYKPILNTRILKVMLIVLKCGFNNVENNAFPRLYKILIITKELIGKIIYITPRMELNKGSEND